MKFKTWYDAAVYCAENFGVHFDMKEHFFECPECGEPIYRDDWKNHNWSICPVCENKWEDVE